MSCGFADRGCLFKLKAKELETHLEACPKRPVSCKNKGCSERPNAEDAVAHAEHCRFRSLSCPNASYGCEERLAEWKLTKHLEVLPAMLCNASNASC